MNSLRSEGRGVKVKVTTTSIFDWVIAAGGGNHNDTWKLKYWYHIVFLQSCSRLGSVPQKISYHELFKQDFSQTGSPSSHTTKSIKALKGPLMLTVTPLGILEHSSSCCCSNPNDWGNINIVYLCICCVGWCIDARCWFTQKVEVEVEQSLTPHPTQYRSFRRRSSQPITWPILTNKGVQENKHTVTKYKHSTGK